MSDSRDESRLPGGRSEPARPGLTARPRAWVSRSLPGTGCEALKAIAEVEVWPGAAPPDSDSLRRAANGVEGLLCLLTDSIDASLLEQAGSLRAVSSYSVGLDHIDLERATALGIPVGHTPGVLTETTADLAFGLLLAAARRIVEADQTVRSGEWTPERSWAPDLLVGRDLNGATLGIIGLGAIGQAVARRAAGFGMRVLGWSRSGRPVPGVEGTSFASLLEESDFISVHVARTPETLGLLDDAAFSRIKPGAILVNTARGGIVDEPALVRALRSGRLGAAALDVFEQEPLPASSELLEAPNLVLAPHIGSASKATRIRMADLAFANLAAALDGRPMPHCANPQVYDRGGRWKA